MFRLFRRKPKSNLHISASALATEEEALAKAKTGKKELLVTQRRIREQIRQNRAAQVECARQLKTKFFKGKSMKMLQKLEREGLFLEQQRQKLTTTLLALDEAILGREALIREYKQHYEKESSSQAPSDAASRYIPLAVKRAVWARDQGRCAECGVWGLGANLQYDHVLPFSKGGANTVNNLQLLCGRCNLRKSDRI